MRKSRKTYNIDCLIKEEIKKQINNNSAPLLTKVEAWSNIQATIYHKKAKKGPIMKVGIIFSVAIILFSIMIAWSPSSGSAFYRITDIFQFVQGKMVNFSGPVDSDNQDAPFDHYFIPVEGSLMVSQDVSLKEAEEMTDFIIKVPSYVPNGFSLKSATVLLQDNEKSSDVYLNYIGESKNEFVIFQNSQVNEFGYGSTINSENNEVKEIVINGEIAILILYPQNGFTELFWNTQSLYISIEGTLTESEIVKIAKSL